MKNRFLNRRKFLTRSALGAGMAFSIPGCSPKVEEATPLKLPLGAGTYLFQGDSITDMGRSKENQIPNTPWSLGTGYVALAVAQMMAENPGSEWKFYNRGISGNKVFQLAERWQEDCLDLKPDVMSILIGVNDFWHTLDFGYDGTAQTYDQDLRTLLSRTKDALPDIKLILAEPFVLKGGSAISDKWFPAFDDYRASAAAIAKDFGAVWIPCQTIFDDAMKQAPATYWSPDGVHPGPAGAYLMAQAWIKAVAQSLS